MSQNEPINMEDTPGGVPSSIKGREVDPDKDSKAEPNTEIKNADEYMKTILEHVPEILHERVSKIQRTDLSLPGLPKDREAYEAYLGAEKMIRDLKRREQKSKMNWKGLPKQSG